MDENKPDVSPVDPLAIRREKIVAQKALARHHYLAGLTNAEIAEEVGVNESTIRKWFRQEGMLGGVARKAMIEQIMERREGRTPPAKPTQTETEIEVSHNGLEASQQLTPADRYQQEMAAAGIRILRDALPSIRTPKTVKELGELDQIIRRNLGLNGKGGGAGAGRLSIDVTLLTEKPTLTIDVDPEYEARE